MLHSLKANLVNLQDENKLILHADCCTPISIQGDCRICLTRGRCLFLVRGFYQNLLS